MHLLIPKYHPPWNLGNGRDILASLMRHLLFVEGDSILRRSTVHTFLLLIGGRAYLQGIHQIPSACQ